LFFKDVVGTCGDKFLKEVASELEQEFYDVTSEMINWDELEQWLYLDSPGELCPQQPEPLSLILSSNFLDVLVDVEKMTMILVKVGMSFSLFPVLRSLTVSCLSVRLLFPHSSSLPSAETQRLPLLISSTLRAQSTP
jgi:hypothetical protein